MKTGVAELPLHDGSVPRWLIARMERLAGILVEMIVEEYGTRGLLERLADPVYFQAINNIIGMDWDSSGSTTVTTAVLKKVLEERELGVKACGGKGSSSRKAPEEIRLHAEKYGLDPSGLVSTSYLVAKVDSAALQAGYQLYHHAFFFDEEGRWAVVQQGMKPSTRTARRYHWFSERVGDVTVEPHSGIHGFREPFALNTVAAEAGEFRRLVVDLVGEGASRLERLVSEALRVLEGYSPLVSYAPYSAEKARSLRERMRRLGKPSLSREALASLAGRGVESFRDILAAKAVGPSAIRALALVAELVYETPPSWRDPVTHQVDPFKFAYAVGGKDGVPFPVDRKTYDELISILEELKQRFRGEPGVFRRLAELTKNWTPPPEEKVPT
ncbi:DUF763 domain-containing protein [Thermofilum pendens]|uniref:DUF763 domain-containing protein n=1 Tax=Thermofilum pendens (strain DSM 2475 / Hrk 5) TaxID=368408 RepID=A1RZF9_THEPD|nr:DUF763 domain-containing protein [Thermofilum pendens]ABL78589.1 protein of unknown function DUF763 [Thermofilum pendens Hrk 5]